MSLGVNVMPAQELALCDLNVYSVCLNRPLVEVVMRIIYPGLWSVILGNVRSLDNKIDDLQTQQRILSTEA